MDLSDWRTIVARDWKRIKDAPAKVKEDRQAALLAVRQSTEALHFIDRELRIDREVVFAAVMTAKRVHAEKTGTSSSTSRPRTPRTVIESAAAGLAEDCEAVADAVFEFGGAAIRLSQMLCQEVASQCPERLSLSDSLAWAFKSAGEALPGSSSSSGGNKWQGRSCRKLRSASVPSLARVSMVHCKSLRTSAIAWQHQRLLQSSLVEASP